MDHNSSRIFNKGIIFLSLITAALSFGVSQVLPPAFVSPTWPYLIVFFLAVSILLHRLMLKSIQGRPARTVNFFMLLTVVKLFLFMGIIIVYALSFRSDALPFGVWFFVYYMVYTFYEVHGILKETRPKNQ